MKKLIGIILALGFISPVFAQSANRDLKTSAELTAFCKIETNNINFGSLISPVTTQQSDGEINVMCSNNAPYSIDMSYGGVYGKGSTGDGSYWTYWSNRNISSKWFARVDSQGNTLEYQWAETTGTIVTTEVAKALGCTYSGPSKCFMGTSAYSYGVMTGISKGDKIAYSFGLPTDNNKVWNKGNNSHAGVGTGSLQKITYKAKIIPDNSSSKYPAPDMYSDTVTANINY